MGGTTLFGGDQCSASELGEGTRGVQLGGPSTTLSHGSAEGSKAHSQFGDRSRIRSVLDRAAPARRLRHAGSGSPRHFALVALARCRKQARSTALGSLVTKLNRPLSTFPN